MYTFLNVLAFLVYLAGAGLMGLFVGRSHLGYLPMFLIFFAYVFVAHKALAAVWSFTERKYLSGQP